MLNLLTQLEVSRQAVLKVAQAGQVNAADLLKLANTEAGLALALVSVPADPVAHLIEAHQEARRYLEEFGLFEATPRVTNGSGIPFTPRKTLRRVLDHALDHLNQIDQWLAWQQQGITPTPTDGWASSALTLPEDTAPLSPADLDAWLWRIDLAVSLVVQRAGQLTPEQLDWQPPDGGWTLHQMLHHLASGEVFYSAWFHRPLPEEPLARYGEANQRFYDQARVALLDQVSEGQVFMEDDLGIFRPDQVVRDVIELEKKVVGA